MDSIESHDLAPIAIFLYNRVDCTRRLFRCLSRSRLFAESPAYVFIDGPKNDREVASVEAVKDLVARINHRDLNVYTAPSNKGLRDSIWDGVTRVCQKYDRVIVLEDDLEFNAVALEYFNRALVKYSSNLSVFSVCGYLPGPGFGESVRQAVVLPYAHPWGWATWSRVWKGFKVEIDFATESLDSQSFRKFFNLGGLNDYADMLRLANSGAIDSWYIYWYHYIFRNRGVSIFPTQSYIRNTGSSGSHSSRYNPLTRMLCQKEMCNDSINLPDHVEIDYWALDYLKSCLESRIQRLSAKIGSVRRMAHVSKVVK